MSLIRKSNYHTCSNSIFNKLSFVHLSVTSVFTAIFARVFTAVTVSVLVIGTISSCNKGEQNSSKGSFTKGLSSADSSTSNELSEISASNLPVGASAILITDYTSVGSQKLLGSPSYTSQSKALSLALMQDAPPKNQTDSNDTASNSTKPKLATLSEIILKTGLAESPFILGRSDKFPTISRRVWFVIPKEKSTKNPPLSAESSSSSKAPENIEHSDVQVPVQLPNIGLAVYGLDEGTSDGKKFIQELVTKLKAPEFAAHGITVTSVAEEELPAKVAGATLTFPIKTPKEKAKSQREEYIPITLLSNGSVLVAGTSLRAALLPLLPKTESSAVADASNTPLIANDKAFSSLQSMAKSPTSSSYGVFLVTSQTSSANGSNSASESNNPKIEASSGPLEADPRFESISHLTFLRSYGENLSDQVDLKFKKPQPSLAVAGQEDRLDERLPGGSIIGMSFGNALVSKLAPILSIAALTGQIWANPDLVALANEFQSLTVSLHDEKQNQGLFPSVILSANVSKPVESQQLLEKGVKMFLKQSGLPASQFEDIKVGDITARSLQIPFGLNVLSANNERSIIISTSAESLAVGIANARPATHSAVRQTQQQNGKIESLPSHLAYKIDFPKLLSSLEVLQGGLSMLTGGEEESLPKDRLNQLKYLREIGSVHGYISSSDTSISITQLYSSSIVERPKSASENS